MKRVHLNQVISMRQNGFTLIEVVIYVAIVAALLGGMTVFLLNTVGTQSGLAPELRIKQTASSTLLSLRHDMAEAQSVNTTASTLGVDPSTLVYVDSSGNTVTVDWVQDTVTISSTSHSVGRLRKQVGASDAVWLTDGNIDVTKWQVDVVRDSSNALTGLAFDVDMDLLYSGAGLQGAWDGQTTISLMPHTTEL